MHGISIAMVTGLLITGGPLPQTIDLFQPREYRYSGGRYQDEPFYYRIFILEPINGDEKYPLVLWLHGYGEGEVAETSGEKNIVQLAHTELVFTTPEDLRRYRFFMVAMQCRRDDPAWFHRHGPLENAARKGDEAITVLMEITNHTIDHNQIDEERIYLTGFCSGGDGCWELAKRYPERFAAMLPFASNGGDVSRADQLVGIPIWAFHSTNDYMVSPRGIRAIIPAVKRAGGNAELTEVDSRDHDCWTTAFRDYDALDWLLAQRQGTAPVMPARTMRWSRKLMHELDDWEPWQLAVQVGVLSLPIVLAWLIWKRRRMRKVT